MLSSLQGSSSHLQGHQQNEQQQLHHQQPSKFLVLVLEKLCFVLGELLFFLFPKEKKDLM